MRYRNPLTELHTHSVINQVPIRENWNLFETDLAIQEALNREGAGWATEICSKFGGVLGTEEMDEHARLANVHSPVLRSFNARGARIDAVDFHPSYHHIFRTARSHQTHSVAWTAERGGHVAHTVLEYLLGQVEGGICCPMTMTYAVLPALKNHSDLYKQLAPKLLSSKYDPRMCPISEKSAITMGMAMTEKQGGSDVRANQTVAQFVSGDRYTLKGHKWFCSAPMSDAFLTLAQLPEGLSCFFVPRWLEDGRRNPIYIQRLKDKLGNRSNASAEIEYHDTEAILIGPAGRGVPTIIDMVHHTRLDCAMAAVGLMRRAIVEAVYHANHRSAFGGRLIDKPLMKNVLADMIVEQEAAVMMVMRIARAYDSHSQSDQQFARLGVAIAKYWTNKRCSALVNEAMECLGGAGYIEESILPRLYREAPLNGIWEGSGNVICLDVLRTIIKSPEALDVLHAEVASACQQNPTLGDRLRQTLKQIQSANPEVQARRIVENLALILQGSLLMTHGHPEVAKAFLSNRFDASGLAYGTLGLDIDLDCILGRYSSVY